MLFPSTLQIIRLLVLDCLRSALTIAMVLTVLGLALHALGMTVLGGVVFLVACGFWGVVIIDVFVDLMKD